MVLLVSTNCNAQTEESQRYSTLRVAVGGKPVDHALCGPPNLINHRCVDFNVEYYRVADKISIRTVRRIKKGDQLYAHYLGANPRGSVVQRWPGCTNDCCQVRVIYPIQLFK